MYEAVHSVFPTCQYTWVGKGSRWGEGGCRTGATMSEAVQPPKTPWTFDTSLPGDAPFPELGQGSPEVPIGHIQSRNYANQHEAASSVMWTTRHGTVW